MIRLPLIQEQVNIYQEHNGSILYVELLTTEVHSSVVFLFVIFENISTYIRTMRKQSFKTGRRIYGEKK